MRNRNLFKDIPEHDAIRLAVMLNHISRDAKVAAYCMQTSRPEYSRHGAYVRGTYIPTTQAELREMAGEVNQLARTVWDQAIAPRNPTGDTRAILADITATDGV
jgi:hypothetical protein